MTEFPHKTRPDSAPWDEQPLPPPPGAGGEGYAWDPLDPPPPPRRGAPDLSALFLVLDGLRRALPRDLQDQFAALVRELLLTLRSLIDWYLARLERGPREPRVEDIPID